ncbi:MAG: hypothetical protein A2Z71_04970 [Chloroflexi bacterium RBG_13_50_21]|nr:MAG: hypothetical protein A2Z71_04970 [Chloroflexi bacterium RBG_13_50_21]
MIISTFLVLILFYIRIFLRSNAVISFYQCSSAYICGWLFLYVLCVLRGDILLPYANRQLASGGFPDNRQELTPALWYNFHHISMEER